MTAAETTDAEAMAAEAMSDDAQAVIDMWLRDDTVVGRWRLTAAGDLVVYDCETKVGPLAGPPISLRLVLSRLGPSGAKVWVAEARRMGVRLSERGPRECLLILPVDNAAQTQGWPSAQAARAGVEAVLRNEHDPASVRLPNLDWWVRE